MVGPTNPSEEHFHRGLWGFDGNVWRKLQLLFGFGGIVEEALVDDDLAGGTNALYGSYVPAGEIWIIQNAGIYYLGTDPTRLQILASGLAEDVRLLYESSPSSDVWYCWGGTCILQEGDRVGGLVNGATAGDDLYFRYAGYKMEIE